MQNVAIEDVLAGRALWTIDEGDCVESLRRLPAECVQCAVTSPPYWALRDYGVAGQIGVEPTPDAYIERIAAVFEEVRRVLRRDGVLWLNLGDSYANDGKWGGTTGGKHTRALHGTSVGRARRDSGLKPKDLVGIPWRVAFALQARGWYLRADVVWSKTNPLPEAVRDRPTRSHEYVFLLSRSPLYFFDPEAIAEPTTGNAHGRGGGLHPKSATTGPGVRQNASLSASVTDLVQRRNARSVWTIPTQPFRGAHFATFPEMLARRCILAGTSAHGACATCGAPWRRVIEVTYVNPGNRSTNGPRSLANRKASPGFATRLERSVTTKGWEPRCACAGRVVVPCVVLDPFAGSGTTGKVAVETGRRFLGVELNPDYIALAATRIESGRRRELELFPTKRSA